MRSQGRSAGISTLRSRIRSLAKEEMLVPGLLIWSIAVVTPVLLALCGYITLQYAASAQAADERAIYRGVREITFVVDREITAAINALLPLTRSDTFRQRNMEAFYSSAATVAQAVGFDLVLFDVRRNEQIINTAFPLRSVLAQGVPFLVGPAQRDALRAGKPALFDVFLGPLVKRHMVAVGVPVVGTEGLDFVLVAALPLNRFADILKQLRLEDDWTATILDRSGTVVARSKDHEQFAGQPAPSKDLIKSEINLATITGSNAENVPFVWVYGRSDLTGWVVTVGIPLSVLRERWYLALSGLMVSGIFIVFSAVSMTVRSSRRFGRALDELRHAISAVRLKDEQSSPGAGSIGKNISHVLAAASAELLAVEHQRQLVASAADVGTWQWNITRQEHVWSDRYREIIGANPSVEATYENFLNRIHPVDRQMVKDTMDRCLSQNEEFDQEFRIWRADNGEERWIHTKARIDGHEADQSLRLSGAVMDVTPRKRAEREVQDTTARLKVLVETVPDGVILVNESGVILLSNPACQQLFGYLGEEVTGKNINMLMPSLSRTAHDRPSDLLDMGSRQVIGAGGEVAGRRKDGSEFALLLSVGEITRSEGSLFVGILHDLTVRKRAERERVELRRRLMRAQEDERLRLAHDLHDEAGQQLAAVMLELKRLETVIGEPGRKSLGDLNSQLDRMAQSLHRIARELRPSSIDDLGLGRALADYVYEWSEQFGIAVDLQCTSRDLDQVSNDLQTVLYRICQEALTNIAKHAVGATAVGITAVQVAGALQLIIEDNGCGFDTTALINQSSSRAHGGLGILGIRERLALFGGELQIESSVGVGTTVFARISNDPAEMSRWSQNAHRVSR